MAKAQAQAKSQAEENMQQPAQDEHMEVDAPQSEEKLPAVSQPDENGINPFEEIGQQAPRRIIGQLLKFSKGDYLYGQENDELPMGSKLIANMDQLLRGWIKWADNKPAEQVMGLVVEGF